jgi:uncharacterized membrane protein YeaQ/YmgE (transglycosylase-associated protein family)
MVLAWCIIRVTWWHPVVGSAAVWVAQEVVGGNDGGQLFAVRMGAVGAAGAHSTPVSRGDLGGSGVSGHAQDCVGIGPEYAHRGPVGAKIR